MDLQQDSHALEHTESITSTDDRDEYTTLPAAEEWRTAEPVHRERHPMRENLSLYVHSKVHQLVRSNTWKEIRVIGKHDRRLPYIISDREKHQKRFNWFRPTARAVTDDILEIACFPGTAYIQHNAMLIATYLDLDKSATTVRYRLADEIQQSFALLSSSMASLPDSDIVIIGYVEQLESICPGAWQSDSTSSDQLLYWKSRLGADGLRITLLGCMVSFWGDISVSLIRSLSQHGLKSLLYVGKAAALQPQRLPNRVIASGDRSYVDSNIVTWGSGLQEVMTLPSTVVLGGHSTVLSPLLDDSDWLSERRAAGDEWIDCEVGLMATACKRLRIYFDYLHIVSDNVGITQESGLWNENTDDTRRSRSALMLEVMEILNRYLKDIKLPFLKKSKQET